MSVLAGPKHDTHRHHRYNEGTRMGTGDKKKKTHHCPVRTSDPYLKDPWHRFPSFLCSWGEHRQGLCYLLVEIAVEILKKHSSLLKREL